MMNQETDHRRKEKLCTLVPLVTLSPVLYKKPHIFISHWAPKWCCQPWVVWRWGDAKHMQIGKSFLWCTIDFFPFKERKTNLANSIKIFLFCLGRIQGTQQNWRNSWENRLGKSRNQESFRTAAAGSRGQSCGYHIWSDSFPAGSLCLCSSTQHLSLEGNFNWSTVACHVVWQGQISLSDSTPRLHTVRKKLFSR